MVRYPSDPAAVITASVSSLKKIDCDVVWQITRGGPDIGGAKRVLEFAPSPVLFRRYLTEWKQKNPEQWWGAYKRQFTMELQSPGVEVAVNQLHALVDMGKRVALVCFCKDHRYCHRSLVAAFLIGRGFTIKEHGSPEARCPTAEQLTMFS